MSFGAFGRELKETALSLLPAIGLIIVFQVAFLRMPLAEFVPILLGLAATVFGFVLFIQGAKIVLLPLGQGIGSAFIERRAVTMLLTFGFLLGIVLTIAEPDVRLLAFQIEETIGGGGQTARLILVAALGLGVFGCGRHVGQRPSSAARPTGPSGLPPVTARRRTAARASRPRRRSRQSADLLA